MTGVLLIGAGGHAKAVAEAADAVLGGIAAYVDGRSAPWLASRRIDSDEAALEEDFPIVMGMGAVTCDALARRLAVFERYAARHSAPPLVHPEGKVSRSAALGAGAIVLAGAVVQPGAVIGRAAIVNTRAVVEHDCKIGDGVHVAPGAVVLGGVAIGRCAMIGAGAVVLPGAQVPENALVPALTRFGGKA